jgi:hypothetical protein
MIHYDVGKSGKDMLSIYVELADGKDVVKPLIKAFGTPSCRYYSAMNKLVALEWKVQKGKDQLARVKRLLKGFQKNSTSIGLKD